MDAIRTAWARPDADQDDVVGQIGVSSAPFDVAPDKSKHTAPHHGSRVAKVAVICADAIAIAIAMVLAAWMRQVAFDTHEALPPIMITGIVSIPVWLCVFARYRLYTAAAVTSLTSEIRRVVHAVAAAVACTGLVGFVLAEDISRAWLLFLVATALPVILVERALVRRVFRAMRSHGRLRRRVVIVGTNAEALGIAQMLSANRALGYEVVGLLKCGSDFISGGSAPVLGSWHEAPSIVPAVDASGVIIATSAIETSVANRLARELIELGFHVELTSGLVDISADRLIARPLGRRPVMYIEPVRRVGWRAVAKRSFDLVVAAAALVVAAPVLLACGIAIKIDSRGPVFFSQVRIGKDGLRFRVRKLRTMITDAEQMLEVLRDQSEVDGPLFKMRDDPRVTRVGRFLRKTSLDEVPQLWNVLRGEMSLVGPRPALPSEMQDWSDEVRSRLRVKPGITGMWQVSGRSESTFDDYVRHDLYYVDNWNLLTDIAIVAKTIPVVLFGRGAY